MALLLGAGALVPAAREGRSLSAKEVVPVAERGSVVAHEVMVVVVMVVSTSPDRKEVVKTDRELVAGVRVDGLDKTQRDPHHDRQKVHVCAEIRQQKRRANRASASERDLERVGVLGGHAERRGILVVLLVETLVHELRVQNAVTEVVPGVLDEEQNGELPANGHEARERRTVRDVEHVANEVEAKDRHGLDERVRNEDLLQAVKILLTRRRAVVLNLVLAHGRHRVEDHPRDRATKVHDLVHTKQQQTRGNDIVVHVVVVVFPLLLEPVQLRGEKRVGDSAQSTINTHDLQRRRPVLCVRVVWWTKRLNRNSRIW